MSDHSFRNEIRNKQEWHAEHFVSWNQSYDQLPAQSKQRKKEEFVCLRRSNFPRKSNCRFSLVLKQILKLAHETHQGNVKTKQLLRVRFFLPDQAARETFKGCSAFVLNQPLNQAIGQRSSGSLIGRRIYCKYFLVYIDRLLFFAPGSMHPQGINFSRGYQSLNRFFFLD